MTTPKSHTTLYRGHVIYTTVSSGKARLIAETDGALAVDNHGLIVGCGSYLWLAN